MLEALIERVVSLVLLHLLHEDVVWLTVFKSAALHQATLLHFSSGLKHYFVSCAHLARVQHAVVLLGKISDLRFNLRRGISSESRSHWSTWVLRGHPSVNDLGLNRVH